ncbi:MAG: GspH/FimT family pseudopilin [Myxococcota bacterium]
MKHAQRGYTLVELITVVAIAGILATAGIGSLQNFIWRQRVNTVAREIYSAITTARSEAVRRSQTVIVQLLLSEDVTLDEVGVFAFVDANDNYQYDDDTDDTVYSYLLNRDTALIGGGNYSESLDFTGSSGFVVTDPPGSTIPRSIFFNAQGFSFTFGASESDQLLHSVTIQIQDRENTAAARQIEVSVAGAASVTAI